MRISPNETAAEIQNKKLLTFRRPARSSATCRSPAEMLPPPLPTLK